MKLTIAKHEDGPFSELGVRINIDIGERKLVYIRVRSVTDQVEVASLEDDAADGYPTKYFTAGGKNITDEVAGDSYMFNARPDRAKKFVAKNKRIEGADPTCLLIITNDGSAQSEAAIAANRPLLECVA